MALEPSHPLITKLLCFGPLSTEDQNVIRSLAGLPRFIQARQALSEEGTAPRTVVLLLEGIACRLKLLPDGRRQIVSFMLPGDLSDLHTFVPRVLDHSVETISPCTILDIARADLMALMERPAIAVGLHVSSTIEEAVVREWLVNVGRRTSAQRVAHLLCEFLFRLKAIGLAEDDRFDFPVTSTDLADSTCLPVAHVHRILQDFRDAGIIDFEGDQLVVEDTEALQQAGGFDEAYLELRPPQNTTRGNIGGAGPTQGPSPA